MNIEKEASLIGGTSGRNSRTKIIKIILITVRDNEELSVGLVNAEL
jgi:hypothetical protein